MSDETVTLTIELPLRTVIACVQLHERQKLPIEAVSQEQLVEGTINSMVPWFEKKGWITPVEDVKATYIAYFGADSEPVSPEPDLDLRDGFAVAEDVEAAVQAKLREKALEATKRDTKPTVVPDVQKPGKMDLLKVNRMDIAVLSTIAPKDVMIDKVTKGIGDAVFRAAVEIVYTSLSPELWGTQTAEQAVKDMMARHEATP